MLLDGRDEAERDLFLDELYEDDTAEDGAMTLLQRDMERRGLKWEEPADG
jgi:hypothetical protein